MISDRIRKARLMDGCRPMTRTISGCKAIECCEKKEQRERYRLPKEVTGYQGFAAHQLCRNSDFREKHYEHFVEIENE